jgi:hypothetical protein
MMRIEDLQMAFLQAIQHVGIDKFKQTSIFMRNWNTPGVVQ